MNVCKECHHRPSDRNDPGDYTGPALTCFCLCHDVADAAPDLLEACKDLLPHATKAIGSLYPAINLAVLQRAKAAIAKAEGTACD